MNTKRTEPKYIVTFEDGHQELFKTIGDMTVSLHVAYESIVQHIEKGTPVMSRDFGRYWIEQLFTGDRY